ncbi:hypothetical protein ACVIGB_002525 [Bradyrhizobium sp. USDA 4341]
MPRPRTPLAKASATGRILHDPKRFKARKDPPSKGPLGKPPKWIKSAPQIEAWNTFADELPWLNHSHRALVEIASEIRGRQITGEELSVNALNLLRLTLGQMGGTPVDASKITLTDDGQGDNDDPSKKYF